MVNSCDNSKYYTQYIPEKVLYWQNFERNAPALKSAGVRKS